MSQDTQFARLVSLACHDLRTPLATVYGFARTLTRMNTLDDQSARYIGMIDQASAQLGETNVTVRVRLHRARCTLASALVEH